MRIRGSVRPSKWPTRWAAKSTTCGPTSSRCCLRLARERSRSACTDRVPGCQRRCGRSISAAPPKSSTSWSWPGRSCSTRLHGFAGILEGVSSRGVATRFLTGDPSSAAVALRGQEEGIGSAVHARCSLALDLLRPLLGLPGFQVRTHDTALYTSIFRVDDRIIANSHVWGSPGAANPVLVLDRGTDDHLWDVYCRSFDRIWERGKPLT
ncbi:putative transcriptional regulator [Kitasatospora setae KM-6054] [Mycobacterium shimoidei]|uniref:Putative transcriptional regulator [Kitasatospora setae KM-6054] n=1 Tax=Mycobacterium shimoidei TaxID=29313 RepID=A0A375Z0V4_MYCSH|nr:putative transcriptional regulator [Kitasatospora setae KM-6054] [Mycobacterium shimoidei]